MTSRVVVLGAGISGLSSCHFLKKYQAKSNKDIDTKIMEKSNRAGGSVF